MSSVSRLASSGAKKRKTGGDTIQEAKAIMADSTSETQRNESTSVSLHDHDPAIVELARKMNVDFIHLRNAWLVFWSKFASEFVGDAKTKKRKRIEQKKKWLEAQEADEKWIPAHLAVVCRTKAVMARSTFQARTDGALAGRCSKLKARVCKLIKVTFPPVHPELSPQEGIGVQCTENLKESVFLAEYCGPRISTQEAKSLSKENQTHLCTITGTGLVVNGIRDPAELPFLPINSFASFVNHSDNPNCYLCVIETINRIFLVTRQALTEGEELTVDYGRNCFEMYHNESI